jgi:hypothetical protein
VFSLMALGVSSAQAEPTAKWLILTSGGVVKTGAELPSQVIGEIENKDGSLLTKVIGLSVRVLCETMTLEGLKLEKEGSLTKGFTALFGGCETFINGKLEAACEPFSAGEPLRSIKTNKLKGLAVLIGGAKRVLIEPEVAGASLVLIQFHEECVLPDLTIFGKLYIKDCKGDAAFSEHLVKHLIEEDTVNSRMWVISDTAEHLETSLDGSAEVFLTGPHTGLRWGGDV